MTSRFRIPLPDGHPDGRRPHAQAHFPPLTAHEALLFVRFLERVCEALWRAHGPAMADLLRREVDAHIARSPKARKAHRELQAQCRAIRKGDDIPF
jgi:hypothetical protein